MSHSEFQDHLETLGSAESLELLKGGGGLGRIGGVVGGRPMIVPVNYVVVDDAVVCRVRRGGDLDRLTADGTVAFEVDDIDNVYHEGWSVLVVGRCDRVTERTELEHLEGLRLQPWAGRDRDLFIRLPLEEVTGRRIHHRQR